MIWHPLLLTKVLYCNLSDKFLKSKSLILEVFSLFHDKNQAKKILIQIETLKVLIIRSR